MVEPPDRVLVPVLEWPTTTADPGRWKWAMQALIPSSGVSSFPPDLYVFEKNPHAMESPFPEVSSQASARQPFADVDGLHNTVLLRTKYDVAQFKISGKIWSQDQYVHMQEFYDWPGLVALRDHFGREFVGRLMDFDVRPQIPTAQRPYKFEYDLQFQLWVLQ